MLAPRGRTRSSQLHWGGPDAAPAHIPKHHAGPYTPRPLPAQAHQHGRTTGRFPGSFDMVIDSCRWLLTRLDEKAEALLLLCFYFPIALPQAKACNRQGREDNVPVPAVRTRPPTQRWMGATAVLFCRVCTLVHLDGAHCSCSPLHCVSE
jgi:hypothetical protein